MQIEYAIATHKARIDQQQAHNAAVHLQIKAQTEAELAKPRVDLDAKLQILDAHIKASAAERQPPSVPGARKAKDGHHYMSDAKRPGKFLMVVPHG